ncbi:MAG: guanylate kinase [Saprospiraceae bacterium]|nr:guanylate kinase [Saprospiraceae bacterium]
MNKMLIFAAPSGSGKTTIVRHLLGVFSQLSFSVSAATRERRAHEVHGRDYYFISQEEFRQRIDNKEFAEWEEVYPGQFYGTLHSELERLWSEGKDIIFDIDVYGAVRLKKKYPEQALTVFVKPPSRDVLVERLKGRGTESEETFRKRIVKAEEELAFENKFDVVLVNDVLEAAFARAEEIARSFLSEQ